MRVLRNLFIAVLAVLGVLYALSFGYKMQQQRWAREDFSPYKSDCEIVNEYMLSICANDVEKLFSFVYDDKHDISSLCSYSNELSEREEILLDDKVKKALNNIAENLIYYGFNYINVTPERIAYEYGLGRGVYVYSRNGRKPQYYHLPNDRVDAYKTYYLGDSWYLLETW